MSEETYFVYAHSYNGSVFYIGAGRGNRHLACQNRSAEYHEIVAAKGKPETSFLHQGMSRKDAMKLEGDEIRLHLLQGHPLVNKLKTGTYIQPGIRERMQKMHAENEGYRRAIAAGRDEYCSRPEVRAARSINARRLLHTDGVQAKALATMRTPEVRALRSRNAKIQMAKPERKEAQRAAMVLLNKDPEHIAKVRASAIARIGRPVRNNAGMEFVCVADAAAWAGCQRSNIRQACQGKNKSAKGYKWEYVL